MQDASYQTKTWGGLTSPRICKKNSSNSIIEKPHISESKKSKDWKPHPPPKPTTSTLEDHLFVVPKKGIFQHPTNLQSSIHQFSRKTAGQGRPFGRCVVHKLLEVKWHLDFQGIGASFSPLWPLIAANGGCLCGRLGRCGVWCFKLRFFYLLFAWVWKGEKFRNCCKNSAFLGCSFHFWQKKKLRVCWQASKFKRNDWKVWAHKTPTHSNVCNPKNQRDIPSRLLNEIRLFPTPPYNRTWIYLYIYMIYMHIYAVYSNSNGGGFNPFTKICFSKMCSSSPNLRMKIAKKKIFETTPAKTCSIFCWWLT